MRSAVRRAAAALALVALLSGAASEDAEAHAGLVGSDPVADATLGASPTTITLTFSEEPEASLSEISVLDEDGAEQEAGDPEPVAGDLDSVALAVSRLPRGAYSVRYRVVSAIDGHATSGAFAFGVGVSPAGLDTEGSSAESETTVLELFARWTLLVGLVALLGGAVAALAGFGGSTGSDLRLSAAGWAGAAAGLVLLAVAQRRTAGSSLGELLDTSVGEALIWRGAALLAAGGALLLAWRSPGIRRGALAAAALCALAAIAAHVEAGHAGASSWPSAVTVTAQVAHFAAVAVWFGGLAALLLGVRGAPSATKAAAVRRFAAVAIVALVVVVVTGTLRAVDELSSFGDLFSTGYGVAVLEKIALIVAIVVLAVRNRRRTVPAAASDLGPLRRTSRAELALALIALAVAAVLGTLAPAVAGPGSAPSALSDSGGDAGDIIEVDLEAVSAEPGPNRFVVQVEDSAGGEAVEGASVTLRFDPLDDPGVKETSLRLKPEGDGSYAGSGSNLAFDGRWGVTVLVDRDGQAVEVPLELDLPIPEQRISPLRLPGKPPRYTMQVENDGFIQISPQPEEEGPSRLLVILTTVYENQAPTEHLVVTYAAGDDPPHPAPLRRLSAARFYADVELEAGANTIVVVADREDGIRLRGRFELDVPEA